MARRDLSAEDESVWQAFARSILPMRSRKAPATRSGKERQTSTGAVSPAPSLPDMPGVGMQNAASGTRSSASMGHVPVDPVQALARQAGITFRVREVIRAVSPAVRHDRVHDRLEINGRQPGLDTTSWNALATGKMKPQKRLDLHGLFAQDAFFKLHHFLHACSTQNIRCVEVITGLGSGQEGGVIRQELPHWLERGDLRPLILAVVHTHKKNKGAVRILLRAKSRL